VLSANAALIEGRVPGLGFSLKSFCLEAIFGYVFKNWLSLLKTEYNFNLSLYFSVHIIYVSVHK